MKERVHQQRFRLLPTRVIRATMVIRVITILTHQSHISPSLKVLFYFGLPSSGGLCLFRDTPALFPTWTDFLVLFSFVFAQTCISLTPLFHCCQPLPLYTQNSQQVYKTQGYFFCLVYLFQLNLVHNTSLKCQLSLFWDDVESEMFSKIGCRQHKTS